MAVRLCRIKSNAAFQVRVVVVSQFGISQFFIDPQATLFVQFQDGRKLFGVWNAASGELLDHRVIRVITNSEFLVFKEAKEVNAQGNEVVVQVKFVGDEDSGVPVGADGGDDVGAAALV